jgi:intracellular septation protein A
MEGSMAMAEDLGNGGQGGFKRMAVDMMSGILFLAIYLSTNDIYLAVGVGVATGLAQAIWMIARRQKTDAMQWMALALVLVLGLTTIFTHNPTFAVFKPSIFEACLAAMMLRPGWMARYTPAYARDFVPQGLLVFWGYLWAGAWFAMAASNYVVFRVFGLKAWAIYTSVSPWALLAALTVLGLLVFPPITRRRALAAGVDLKARRRAG